MYDKELVSSSLTQIQTLLDTITERSAKVNDIDDFLTSPSGMLLLDAVCMNLIALGEAVKNLEKCQMANCYLNTTKSIGEESCG